LHNPEEFPNEIEAVSEKMQFSPDTFFSCIVYLLTRRSSRGIATRCRLVLYSSRPISSRRQDRL